MKLKVLLFTVMFCGIVTAQGFIPSADMTNYTMNWSLFRCDSLATASADTDTVAISGSRVANMKIYAFAQEAQIKFSFAGDDTLSEWCRIPAGEHIDIPGLFRYKLIYYKAAGTGSIRITYTIF